MANFITNFISGIGNKIETLLVGAFLGIISDILILKFFNKEYPFDILMSFGKSKAKKNNSVEKKVMEIPSSMPTMAQDEDKDDSSIKETMTNIISIPQPRSDIGRYAIVG